MARNKKQETTVEQNDDLEIVETSKKNIVTYVGAGESSPPVINFMGMQKFMRGRATEVTDQFVLSKIKGNPSFVLGEVDFEKLEQMDMEAAEEVAHKRKIDARVNAAYSKNHVGQDGEE